MLRDLFVSVGEQRRNLTSCLRLEGRLLRSLLGRRYRSLTTSSSHSPVGSLVR